MPNLLCSTTASVNDVYAIELTAPQLSDLRVAALVTVLRTPARPQLVRPATCSHGVTPMKNLIARFVKDESGATAIEYGLIAAGISLAIIAVVNGLGSNLNTKFNSINTSLK